jgi:signal transduction histidine kinase
MLASSARTEATRAELLRSLGTNESLLNDIREQAQTEAMLTDFSGQIIQAQDDERKRIAGELHDTTGQVLAAVSMNLSQLKRSSARKNLAKLTECQDLITTAASEIRNLSYLLHPPLINEGGLGSAITEYTLGFEARSGLKISVEISDDVGRLNGKREIALYRIVQEGLGNIHRHSGSRTARIKLFRDKENIVLEISDEGSGMKRREDGKLGEGVGLRSMRERIRPFAGTLEIESSAAGTKLKVIWPQASAAKPQL